MIPKNLAITAGVLLALVVGMSLYLWELRRRQASETLGGSATPRVAAPASGHTESVTIILADDSKMAMRQQPLEIALPSDRQLRALELLRKVVDLYQEKNSTHPMAAAAEIRGVYLVAPGTAVIDMNAPLADTQASGILAEELTVVSLIQTLSANVPGIRKVKVLVEGKERDTLAGHVDLTGFFDVAQVSQLANQLTAQ